MGINVSEYFLLNYNSAESRTLPDSIIISILEILEITILLDEIFPNSELAGKEKSGINQNN